jgi:hypothetical protein
MQRLSTNIKFCSCGIALKIKPIIITVISIVCHHRVVVALKKEGKRCIAAFNDYEMNARGNQWHKYKWTI